jgi:hypothetical protein
VALMFIATGSVFGIVLPRLGVMEHLKTQNYGGREGGDCKV